MSYKEQILGRVEKKRVILKLRVLPETAAALKQYVRYLSELAARQGLNRHQVTTSFLLDQIARSLCKEKSFRRWLAEKGSPLAAVHGRPRAVPADALPGAAGERDRAEEMVAAKGT